MWGWIIAAVVGGIAVISYAQYRATAGIHRPLSSRQPERPQTSGTPLGLEAVDMKIVNAANRRNESYERGQTNWTSRGHMAAATDVTPLPDDATYATRYHTAFIKDKKDTTDD